MLHFVHCTPFNTVAAPYSLNQTNKTATKTHTHTEHNCSAHTWLTIALSRAERIQFFFFSFFFYSSAKVYLFRLLFFLLLFRIHFGPAVIQFEIRPVEQYTYPKMQFAAHSNMKKKLIKATNETVLNSTTTKIKWHKMIIWTILCSFYVLNLLLLLLIRLHQV